MLATPPGTAPAHPLSVRDMAVLPHSGHLARMLFTQKNRCSPVWCQCRRYWLIFPSFFCSGCVRNSAETRMPQAWRETLAIPGPAGPHTTHAWGHTRHLSSALRPLASARGLCKTVAKRKTKNKLLLWLWLFGVVCLVWLCVFVCVCVCVCTFFVCFDLRDASMHAFCKERVRE
jgi:hypothetical protein